MRLIDADKLMEQKPFTTYCGHLSHWGKAYLECADKAREAVNNAPTIDPDDCRPQGRWKQRYGDKDEYIHSYCSNCKSEALFEYVYVPDYDEDYDGEWTYIGKRENGIEENLTDYCPFCGARMYGKETDINER